MTYTIRVPGMTAWSTGLSYAEATRELELANRICQPGHIIVKEAK